MTTLVLPANPQLPGPDVSTRPANPILDWLNLIDSDGGRINHYRLVLEPGSFDILHRVVYAGGADFLYTVYLVGSAYASALMRWVLDPNQWLGPVSNFYQTVTAHIYDRVPPTAIMVVTFSILILSVFVVRNGTSAGAMPHQARANADQGMLSHWLPSHSQIGKAQWQRVGSGMVMMGVVAALVSNPFKLIQEVLGGVIAVSNVLSFTDSHGGAATYQTATTTDFMRAVTFLVNYRALLDADCARAWSLSINVGGSNPACLEASQRAAADPDLWTVVLAGISVLIAWAFLSFAIVVALEFFKHLSMSVGLVVGAALVAAGTLARRRPYDMLGKCAALGGVHFTLALVVLFVAGTGPSLFLMLVTSVLSFTPVFVQVLLAALGYWVSGKVILFFMEKETSLFKLFKHKVEASKTWINLYSSSAPPSVLSTLTNGAMDKPTAWATRQYNDIRDRSTTAWNKLRSNAGQGRMGDAVPDIIEDSPEFLAATERVALRETPTATVVVSGDGSIPAAISVPGPTDVSEPAQVPEAVVAAAVPTRRDGWVVATTEGTATRTNDGQLPMVWFRGGLPQFVPPPPQYVPPSVLYPPIQAPQAPSVSATPGVVVEGNDFATRRTRRTATIRAEAALLHGTADAPRSAEQALATITETYQGFRPSQPDPGESSPRRAPLPDLRSVLAAAQWTHRFNHNRNMLHARGIDATPVLSDEEESVERIVFATDAAGNNCVELKNERGFGDWI